MRKADLPTGFKLRIENSQPQWEPEQKVNGAITILAIRKPSAETEPMLAERMARLGILPDDVEESFARSRGPGGQHVNKVETLVRLVHRPSGICVAVSDHRSREMNRRAAWVRLTEKLEEIKKARQLESAATRSKKRAQSGRRPAGVKRKMVESKRRRGETKKLRGRVSD